MTAQTQGYCPQGLAMQKIRLFVLALFLLSACTPTGIDHAAVVMSDNSTVIDVRTEQEYRAGHLKNSLNLPYDTIKQTITVHVPDKNTEIILYCRSGRRSGIAKTTLDAMGYKNVINAGGYETLKRQETQD
jgi:phage shock protein E